METLYDSARRELGFFDANEKTTEVSAKNAAAVAETSRDYSPRKVIPYKNYQNKFNLLVMFIIHLTMNRKEVNQLFLIQKKMHLQVILQLHLL